MICIRKTRAEGFGKEAKKRILLGSFVLSSGYYDAYYLKALKTKALIKKAFDEAFVKYDVLLAPASPSPAPRLGESLTDSLKMYLSDIYTVAVNLAGLPAISMPWTLDSQKLPVGLQFIGNCFEEKKGAPGGNGTGKDQRGLSSGICKGGRIMEKQYETVIGLEVHVELSTESKIFCGCSTKFGGAPNTHTCPVCAGLPGALPVLNKQVVEYALALGLAANCQINQYCKFDRKNYFYPDNPQNYQISQLYLPICHDGFLEIQTAAGPKKIRIHEMHMEEDAGKLIHDEWDDCSLVDYNRSGVPLIEIVSEPDMRNAQEVIAYLEKLRLICQYLGVSDCKLQEGSMRADVNLSVRELGSKELGTRTEMKNLNSFKAIARAIEGERARQIELLEEGRPVIQETRRWDDNKEYSYAMRSKEDAKDYRYFPDPDLPPVRISDEWIKRIREAQPELQEEKAKRYMEQYGLSDYDAGLLTQSRHLGEMFEKTAAICQMPKKAANWYIGETLRLVKEEGMETEDISFSPEHLAELILMTDRGELNNKTAKEVFRMIFTEDVDPVVYAEEKGLKTVLDTGLLEETVAKVLEENPDTVKQYLDGKTKVTGFLVGQIMRQMKGKADPKQVNQLLSQKLKEAGEKA